MIKDIHKFSLVFLLIIPSVWSLNYGESLSDPVLEQRAKRLYREIRCPVCAGQSIEASNAQMAQDLRKEVRQLLSAGETDDEIIQHLKERHGESVSLSPLLCFETSVLWLMPFVLLALGLFWIWKRRDRNEDHLAHRG